MSAVTTIDGNCIALDDGEPCVCVQSISAIPSCAAGFVAAVLPLDRELEAALFHRADMRRRCAVCGGAVFSPSSNRGKYCPECAGRMKRIRRRKAQAETTGYNVTL